MGVQGLGKYLRDNRRALAKTICVPQKDAPPTTLVIDGWSFIYALYFDSRLPWVYGGEYAEFSDLVKQVVKAWISIGLRVHFVFDGAYPRLKFLTGRLRMEESIIKPSLLYFRTSPASRVQPRIIPPLIYSNTVQALKQVDAANDDLQLHFADEEGDPYAVELAGRLGGYVVGNDSDFIILNSEGYLGYIPLDEMVWSSVETPDGAPEVDDFGFTPAKPKRKKPEASLQTLSLLFTSPCPCLLVPSPRRLFFDRQSTSIQRIERVATALRSIITASTNRKHKPMHQIGSVMDLIDRAVKALLLRASSMGSAEIDSVIDRVVDSTLQYAIPKHEGSQGLEGLWATDFCALHPPDICPLLPMISRNVIALAEISDAQDGETEEMQRANQVRAAYLDAYREGVLSPRIMDVLSTGTYWPRLPLEHPDIETVAVSIGRDIRSWGYSILDDAVGIEAQSDPAENDSPPNDELGEMSEESDEDELIDVMEEESDDEEYAASSRADPLAPLKGALQQLHAPEASNVGTLGGQRDSPSTRGALQPARPKVVIEHVRRGTHIAEDPVEVPPLSDLADTFGANFADKAGLPLPLWPEETRLAMLLHALKSHHPHVASLSPDTLLPVLAVRWVIMTLHTRALEAPSIHRQGEQWTRQEAKSVLAALLAKSSHSADNEPPPVIDRHIQMVAQVAMALESISHFAQILLLPQSISMTALHYSGRQIHSYLTANQTSPELPVAIWHACEVELVGSFAEERRSKSRKSKNRVIPVPQVKMKASAPSGLFAMLIEADV
ncbi:Asteroid domain-containing protein [Pleurotus pulmonarius]